MVICEGLPLSSLETHFVLFFLAAQHPYPYPTSLCSKPVPCPSPSQLYLAPHLVG